VTPPEQSPELVAAGLTAPQRVLLFCVASRTDHRKAGVSSASVQLAIMRKLVVGDGASSRLFLTERGRAVLAALLRE
jgi:hypothetical protein